MHGEEEGDEQIVRKLREAEVLLAQSRIAVLEAVTEILGADARSFLVERVCDWSEAEVVRAAAARLIGKRGDGAAAHALVSARSR